MSLLLGTVDQPASWAAGASRLCVAPRRPGTRRSTVREERPASIDSTPEDPRAGTFDPSEFAEELERADGNRAVGTSLWFQNEHLKVWEVLLEPGERGPFHAHTRRYFWTCVEGGVGLQRRPDGTYRVREYRVGDTSYGEYTPEEPLVHDLENVGEERLRFVTVELLD